MAEEDIVQIIKKYQETGSKYGLDRTRALLDKLGSPDDGLEIIHVAGTNGKGSTCAYLTSILVAAGRRTGTFTSPEVYSYNENFAVDGAPLDGEKLRKYLAEAYEASLAFADKPTAFEVETAAALTAFFREGCKYAVLECGLGGLNDSTNAVRSKRVAAITSVSLEHTQILGKTLAEICRQKAGIIKNCPAVVSYWQDKTALQYFISLGAKAAGEGLEVTERRNDGQTFRYGGEEYEIRMRGVAQAYNAATAVEVAKILGVDGKYIKEGLATARLNGRVEKITSGSVDYFLDGSHNPASFAPLLETVGAMRGDKTLVFGCLSDKDAARAAEILRGGFDRAFIFSPQSYRAMEREKIYAAFKKYFNHPTVCDSLTDALERADGQIIAICGTFTVLKEAKEWIEKRR